MTPSISVKNLSKRYKNSAIPSVNDLSFTVYPGQVLGILGANGSGKTTTLKSLLGLIDYQGDVNILGHNTRASRIEILKNVAFISDTNTLPTWMSAQQAVQAMADLHPNFNPDHALAALQKTTIFPTTKIKHMSKGMIVQLHLALVLAVNAQVLILDEPTLGLDILYQRHFYDTLINEYMTDERTIVITTHQIEEFESLFTHVLFVKKGQSLYNNSAAAALNDFVWVEGLHNDALDARTTVAHPPRSLIKQVDLTNRTVVSRPTLSDVFAALAKETV